MCKMHVYNSIDTFIFFFSLSLWLFILKKAMYKLSAVLKRLKPSTAVFWGPDGLPATTEGWYPLLYVFKPKERENASLQKRWSHGRDC